MNNVLKFVIFISSYIPIFVMVFLNNLKSFSKKEIYNTWESNRGLWICFLVISILSLVGLVLIILIMNKILKNGSEVEIKDKLKSVDGETINYFFTFIIPIMSLKPSNGPSILLNLIFMLLEAVYFISNNKLQYNIFLLIFGYHVYSFGDDNILITKVRKSDLLASNSKVKQLGITEFYFYNYKNKR